MASRLTRDIFSTANVVRWSGPGPARRRLPIRGCLHLAKRARWGDDGRRGDAATTGSSTDRLTSSSEPPRGTEGGYGSMDRLVLANGSVLCTDARGAMQMTRFARGVTLHVSVGRVSSEMAKVVVEDGERILAEH